MRSRHWQIAEGMPADAEAMVALDERNFARGDRFRGGLWRTILAQAATGEMLTLVTRQQGTVIGAIVGEFSSRRHTLTVWSIAVDEPYRGTGLAGELMAELLRRSPSLYRNVELDARRDNERARRFYERLGFRQLREIRSAYADGTDAIRYATSMDALRTTLGLVGEA